MSATNQIYPENVNNFSRIVNVDTYNGRVNIIEPTNPNARFQMFEKIAVNNKATEHRDALNGNWEHNVIAQVFFSTENIQIIQNGLRAGVYKMSNSKILIPPQNINNLKIVMRSTYLQYAEHYPSNIREQVAKLNKLVLDWCIPEVYGEAVAYLNYCQDQSSLVLPIDLPKQNDRAYKQLELKEWV
jgi:hypothetical protein